MEAPGATPNETAVVKSVSGTFVVVEHVRTLQRPKYAEAVEVHLADGSTRRGQVVEATSKRTVVLVYEGTAGISPATTRVTFTGDRFRLGVSKDMLGRVFNSYGAPIDKGPSIRAQETLDIQGLPLNPCRRVCLEGQVETGISAIDTMISIVPGQKISIFSAAGLPHNEVVAQICRQARLVGKGGTESDASPKEDLVIVLALLGVNMETARFFRNEFKESDAEERVIVFLNLASDSMLERLLAPRLALTAAEFLAFRCGMHVLVVLTDMSAYVDAWSTSRGDPRARGLHGELAGLYERAGCAEGSQGSITLVPVITMPNDDVAHRIPQAMGHVTEGQIVLDRHLHRRGVYPPINLRHSLSHLMRRAVGREDAFLSDQLCATYAAAKEVQLWRIVAGTEEEEDQSLLSSLDLVHLDFLDRFEYALVDQGRHEWRGVGRSFDIARSLLRLFPREALRHLPDHIAARLYDLD